MIRKINKELLIEIDLQYRDFLCFIKLPYCKLFRIISTPEEHSKNVELRQVLNTLCLRFDSKTGVYFFNLDAEAVMDVGETLFFMGIDAIFLQPETIPIFPSSLN